MSKLTIILIIVILFVLILCSAFFSAAETAYSSITKSELERKSKKNKRTANLIKKHHSSFGWTLATILICNNLVNISASSLITYFLSSLMGATTTVAIISTFIMTPIIVIFGEIFPKLLAKKYSYSYISKIVYLMEFFNYLFFPITFLLSKMDFQSNITNSEKELKTLITLAKKEGVLDVNEATLAAKSLDLDSTKISKIMMPKSKIIFLNKGDDVSVALKLFKESGFSRMPVKHNSQFIGIVLLKDIFLIDKKKSIDSNILKISNISQHVLSTKALEMMRYSKSHMLFVSEKQESNKIVGILTIEDILEELVGEIYDEHDKELKTREIAHFKWVTIGNETIENIEKTVGLKLKNTESLETIKQWIQFRINRKIKKGLKYSYKGKIFFKVLSNKNNQETIIEITKK